MLESFLNVVIPVSNYNGGAFVGFVYDEIVIGGVGLTLLISSLVASNASSSALGPIFCGTVLLASCFVVL